MQKDATFVRMMTEGLKTKEPTTKEGGQRLKEHKTYEIMERVDFGGADGHVAEGGSFDLETLRVTRCATTRSAITAYFCGAEVATNQDLALGYNGKPPNVGTDSFRQYLACRHEHGLDIGTYKRAVYRLGISCKDNLAGYNHAYSIVAQPDGTYFWLQSFVGHYSLATWMQKSDITKQSGLAAHLTYDELMGKLDRIDRLMSINSWSEEANADYNDLFNVDKNLEVLIVSNGRKIKQWNSDHRLSTLTWDEACEYPLPEGFTQTHEQINKQGRIQDAEEKRELPGYDKCNLLMAQMSFSDIIGVSNLLDLLSDLEKDL